MILKPLPVREPAGLVLLGDARAVGVASRQTGSFSLALVSLYKHLREVPVFTGLTAFQSDAMSVAVGRPRSNAAQTTRAKLVSGNYFEPVSA